MRGGLAFDGGVHGEDHLARRTFGDARDQRIDAQFARPDAVQGRECSSQNVIAAFEDMCALHRPQIGDVLDDADLRRIALRIAA